MGKSSLKPLLAVIFATLSLSLLQGQNITLRILPEEIEEITTDPELRYLFIGEELTEIKSIVMRIQSLVEFQDPTSALNRLVKRYKKGLKTAPQELVIAVLEETEKLIEKKHETFDDTQLQIIAEKFTRCCEQIENGELKISITQPTKTIARGPRSPRFPTGNQNSAAPEAGTVVSGNMPAKDLFVANDLTVGGDVDIHGNTHYNGNFAIDGTLSVGSSSTFTGTIYPITGIEAGPSGILNVGITDVTDTLNLGTGGTVQAVNIGTGTGVTTINLGSTGDIVNVFGTTNYIGVTNLEVADKNITINKGGIAASATNAGIDIEEGGSITGYIHTTADRNGIEIKAPAGIGPVIIKPENSEATLQIIASNNERILTEKSSSNCFVGRNSGNLTLDPALATGNYGFGFEVLNNLTTGNNNVGMGNQALVNATSGSGNIGLGQKALYHVTTGDTNIAIGQNSMGNSTEVTGTANVGVGASSLQVVTTGSSNVGIGNSAFYNLTEGSNNVAIGYECGLNKVSGDYNIYIGAKQAGLTSESNRIRIGITEPNANATQACVIGGIDKKSAGTDVAVVMTQEGTLGTIASTSANITAPEVVVDNIGGTSASLTLKAEVDTPTAYSSTCQLTTKANTSSDFQIIQNGTTRITLNEVGLTLSSLDQYNELPAISGMVPIIDAPCQYTPSICYGRVNSDGTKHWGPDNWTSQLMPDGWYHITFSRHFIENYMTIVVTPRYDEPPAGLCNIQVQEGLPNEVYVGFKDPAGPIYQAGFYFVAIGN